MKTKITYSLLAAALACGLAHGQAATAYTTPVGYTTTVLAPGQYNLTGLTLFNPQVAAGIFESNTSTTLVDDQAAFALNATTSYVIEFPNGATIIALGSDISGTTVSNLTGITASYLGNYIIRTASTVSSVFGATNQSGLAASPNADPTEADKILLPNGSGGFITIFYSTYTEDMAFNGWLDAESFAKVPDQVINPEEGFFVQSSASVANVSLVLSGEVKKTPTSYVVDQPYNLISGVYPAGATLTTSGLSTYLQGSANADPTEADNILLPSGPGTFVTAFYSTYTEDMAFNGWLNAETFAKIPNQEVTPGFFIKKVGPSFTGLNTPPAQYPSL